MRIYFPQRMEMHHATKDPSPIAFDFKSEDDYNDALRNGWVFNKAELKKEEKTKVVNEQKESPEVIDKQEEEAENMPESKETFNCGECNFEGKNAQSLRMHIRHNHKEK